MYGAVWLTGIGGFQAAALVSGKDLGHQLALPTTILIRASLGFAGGMIFALGEEIGWRGFPGAGVGTTRDVRHDVLDQRCRVGRLPLPFDSVCGL